jgi:hypothetical protein
VIEPKAALREPVPDPHPCIQCVHCERTQRSARQWNYYCRRLRENCYFARSVTGECEPAGILFEPIDADWQSYVNHPDHG